MRLFLRNFFLYPQDPKIDQKPPQKKKNSGRTEGSQDPPWDFNRPVVLNIANLPELGRALWICHFDQALEAISWIQLWKPKETKAFFNAHTRLIEMTSGLYDGYSYWIKKARWWLERCLHMKAHRGGKQMHLQIATHLFFQVLTKLGRAIPQYVKCKQTYWEFGASSILEVSFSTMQCNHIQPLK